MWIYIYKPYGKVDKNMNISLEGFRRGKRENTKKERCGRELA